MIWGFALKKKKIKSKPKIVMMDQMLNTVIWNPHVFIFVNI